MTTDKWSEKLMHGKFPNHLGEGYIDIQQSFQWMKYSGLKGEAEGLKTSPHYQAQHQVLQ